MQQVIDQSKVKASGVDWAEVDKIATSLRAVCVMVDALVERSTVEKVDEEQLGPLSADQLRRRNERDTKRRERITKVNTDSVAKMADIRKDMGK